MTIVSPIGRGQANEFINKLEDAGFGSGLAQQVVESKDNAFAKELTRFAQNREIMISVMEAILKAPPELIEYWTERRRELASGIWDFVNIGARNTIPAMLVNWQKFYLEKFGLEKNFSNISVPDKPNGFCRLLVLPAGITSDVVLAKCREYFEFREDPVHGSSCPINDRGNINDYAVWVPESVGPDGESKNISASDCWHRCISGITFAERLIYELKYFSETGAHLDTSSVTICAGSHYGDDTVPVVCFNSYSKRVAVGHCLKTTLKPDWHVRVAKR